MDQMTIIVVVRTNVTEIKWRILVRVVRILRLNRELTRFYFLRNILLYFSKNKSRCIFCLRYFPFHGLHDVFVRLERYQNQFPISMKLPTILIFLISQRNVATWYQSNQYCSSNESMHLMFQELQRYIENPPNLIPRFPLNHHTYLETYEIHQRFNIHKISRTYRLILHHIIHNVVRTVPRLNHILH